VKGGFNYNNKKKKSVCASMAFYRGAKREGRIFSLERKRRKSSATNLGEGGHSVKKICLLKKGGRIRVKISKPQRSQKINKIEGGR